MKAVVGSSHSRSSFACLHVLQECVQTSSNLAVPVCLVECPEKTQILNPLCGMRVQTHAQLSGLRTPFLVSPCGRSFEIRRIGGWNNSPQLRAFTPQSRLQSLRNCPAAPTGTKYPQKMYLLLIRNVL